jgi:predicted NAD/FAD-binding protein
MNILDRILTGVTDHPTIAGGALQMLHNLAEQVRATALNPTAVDQMADLIHTAAPKIVAAILANTPSQVVTVHPEHAAALVEKAADDAHGANPAA